MKKFPKQLNFTINDDLQSLINDLRVNEDGTINSQSKIIREAIIHLHEKYFPEIKSEIRENLRRT